MSESYELLKARLTLEYLRGRYERRLALREKNPNAMSLEELEEAEYRFHLQQIEVEQLESTER